MRLHPTGVSENIPCVLHTQGHKPDLNGITVDNIVYPGIQMRTDLLHISEDPKDQCVSQASCRGGDVLPSDRHRSPLSVSAQRYHGISQGQKRYKKMKLQHWIQQKHNFFCPLLLLYTYFSLIRSPNSFSKKVHFPILSS